MTESVQDVAKPDPWVRIAAEARWANPDATWEQIAAAAGRSREQLRRVRQTEEWEIAFREAGNQYIERLAPAAFHALLIAWSRGTPTGALEVLRSFGFLRPAQVDVTHQVVSSIDEELARLFAEVRERDKPGDLR